MFAAFHIKFPDIGIRETRTVNILGEHDAVDSYVFVELYCEEEGCDCRRVLVNVVSERDARAGLSGHVATLSYGWEPLEFYRKWARHSIDAVELDSLKGPALQLLAPQTARSPQMLAFFCDLLADEAYVARIKRHYAMFRARLEGSQPHDPPQRNRAERRTKRRG